MPKSSAQRGLFPALLKYWRGRKGLSQLDLALAADVSSRHISFLETGRAQPSRDMILRLGATLGVPLRDQNAMLRAAGMEEEYEEPGLDGALPPVIETVLERMLAQQEPYPLVVMNRRYDILRFNRAAGLLLQRFVADPTALGDRPLNGFHLLFDPRLLRPAIVDWELVGRTLLWRLHRELLDAPADDQIRALVEEMHAYPDVPEAWRHPDLSVSSPPVLAVRLRRDDLQLSFITTVTAFNAPQNVTLEELRIESYYPLDHESAELCARMADEA
jgi:transcriptional regulator with XRE-family HTH domain